MVTLLVMVILCSTQRKPVAKMEAMPRPSSAVPRYSARGEEAARADSSTAPAIGDIVLNIPLDYYYYY